MGLASGTRLGPYEVLSPLGAGGMGEVYRARDTRLGREVALKVLPDAMAHDAERMARFQREAQVLASLNHPNIAAIHGLEESTGMRALVMEFVDGATLAEQIAAARPLTPGPSPQGRGLPAGQGEGLCPSPLPIEDSLALARQIAEALEYAHERGIIHRDLKPANIKITSDGTVKVLDFGLAKALDVGERSTLKSGGQSPPLQDSPTLTAAATQAGIILGTAAYMSPEQARGKTVDRRADIWSFGCVLYEMLTGKRLFEGETVTDVLAAVVRAEPDWNWLPPDTPARIRGLLCRCLVKDPRQRLQAIGEARIAIEEAISGVGERSALPWEGEALPYGPAGERRLPRQRALLGVVAAVLIFLAGVGGWWLGIRSVPTEPNWSGELLPGPAIAFWPRVSPDGRLIAFQAMVDNLTQVAVMDATSGNWTVLTHERTEGPVGSLCWSSDGSKIYFDRFAPQPLGVYSIPALGGEKRLVLANAASPQALADGTMVLVRTDPDRRNQIYHFWPENGRLQGLNAWVELDPAAGLRVFPDGKQAVFYGTVGGTGADSSQHLYLLDIASGVARRLAPQLSVVQTAQLFPLAVTRDGQSVLLDLPSGNLHRIVAVPASGNGRTRTLMELTSAPWTLDVGSEGSIYVDQVDRPQDLLKIPRSGGTPEVLASTESYPYPSWLAAPLEFPDGRFLLPATVAGRKRLLLGKRGGSLVPLLDVDEENSPPVARVGSDQVALMIGSGSVRTLAIASVKDGRIVQRFQATQGRQISAVAASPDGKTIFYVEAGNVWSIPGQGGDPRKICAGDGVAVDSAGRSLVVNLNEQGTVRLERVPLSGGPGQPLQVKGDLPVIPMPLGPDSIGKDGKLLVGVSPVDSWFFALGIFDPASGAVTRVPLNYTGDIMVPGWADDGSILATADPERAHLWRFRPEARENGK